MESNHTTRGISLLEVMIAFAVTSMLLAATLPNYTDYMIRERVSEGLKLASSAQETLIGACEIDEMAIVSDRFETGYSYDPEASEDRFVEKITIEADCAKGLMGVVVWTGHSGADVDPIIEFTADFQPDFANGKSAGQYSWTCRTIRGELNHVPFDCRKRHRES